MLSITIFATIVGDMLPVSDATPLIGQQTYNLRETSNSCTCVDIFYRIQLLIFLTIRLGQFSFLNLSMMIAYDLSNFPIFKNLSVLNNLSVLKKLCFGTIAIHLSKLSDGARQFQKIKIQILLLKTNIIQLVALLSLLVTTQKRKCDDVASSPSIIVCFCLFLGYLLTYCT